MEEIELHGIRLTILTRTEADQHRVLKECTALPGGGFFVYGLRTKGDWVKASGIEMDGSVDYAVPQMWANEHPDWHRYVWYYPKENGAPGHLFGRALSLDEMLVRINKQIRYHWGIRP